jgi:hypothetical protein
MLVNLPKSTYLGNDKLEYKIWSYSGHG